MSIYENVQTLIKHCVHVGKLTKITTLYSKTLRARLYRKDNIVT